MKRPYLIPLAVLCCAGIAYAAGSISVTGYPAVPRTLKGGTGINIAPDGTFSATGDAVASGTQPFQNLSGALRGKYLPIAGTAVNAANAQAYKGNSAPSATEFSYLQGVKGPIQGQISSANVRIDTLGSTVITTSNIGSQTVSSATGNAGTATKLQSARTINGVPFDGSANIAVRDAGYLNYSGHDHVTPALAAASTATPGDSDTFNFISSVLKKVSWTNIKATLKTYFDTLYHGLTVTWSEITGKPTFATVATSGNYSDLNGKPAPYTLPTASTIVKGGVMVDGSSIQIDGGGVIHSTVSAGVSSVNGYTGDIDLQTTDIVGFGSYSSSVNSRLAGKMDNVNPTYTGTLTTTNADGTHWSYDYNTASCPSGVDEGTKCTLPSGIWWYKSGSWTQAGLLPAYTLPPATASVIGGVKPGTALSVDGNGVISVMLNSLGPSGLVTAGLAGDQTISSGFAYVATATPWKATFNSYTSTKQTTVFANYSGTVCAASGSKLYWPNPVTFANNSSVCAKLRTGTRATVQMLGGKTYATATQNLQKASLPMASVSPTTLAFGSVVAGNTSSPLTATLTNSGLTNLVTGTPTISGTDAAKFAISSDACNAATVTPGTTCLESVTFTPGTAGTYSAQLNILHNASGSPTVVALTGTGISGGGSSSAGYTTLFASDWSGTGVLDTGSPYGGVSTGWTSSTDTSSQGANTSGSYVTTLAASTANSYLTKSVAAHNDIEYKFDFKASSYTGIGANVPTIATVKNSALLANIILTASGGNYSGWRFQYQNGSNAATNISSSTYTFTAGHTYSVRLLLKCSATTSSGDGTVSLYVSDNGAAETLVLSSTGLNTYYSAVTNVVIGIMPGATAVTNTYTWDNVVHGYK